MIAAVVTVTVVLLVVSSVGVYLAVFAQPSRRKHRKKQCLRKDRSTARRRRRFSDQNADEFDAEISASESSNTTYMTTSGEYEASVKSGRYTVLGNSRIRRIRDRSRSSRLVSEAIARCGAAHRRKRKSRRTSYDRKKRKIARSDRARRAHLDRIAARGRAQTPQNGKQRSLVSTEIEITEETASESSAHTIIEHKPDNSDSSSSKSSNDDQYL